MARRCGSRRRSRALRARSCAPRSSRRSTRGAGSAAGSPSPTSCGSARTPTHSSPPRWDRRPASPLRLLRSTDPAAGCGPPRRLAGGATRARNRRAVASDALVTSRAATSYPVKFGLNPTGNSFGWQLDVAVHAGGESFIDVSRCLLEPRVVLHAEGVLALRTEVALHAVAAEPEPHLTARAQQAHGDAGTVVLELHVRRARSWPRRGSEPGCAGHRRWCAGSRPDGPDRPPLGPGPKRWDTRLPQRRPTERTAEQMTIE